MPDLPADPCKRLFMKLHLCQPVTRLESQLSGRVATIDGNFTSPFEFSYRSATPFRQGKRCCQGFR
mgnify:CR=1 FL=1